MIRRQSLPWQLAAVVPLIVVSLACSHGPGNENIMHPRFRFEPINDKSLGLFERGRPVLVYNHGEIASDQAPKATPRSNYVHPIYGLDGEVLTDDFPADHVNHRGLYWAWPHVKVGETEYDLWGMRGIRYKAGEPEVMTANVALLSAENGWYVGDKQVMREQLRLRVHPATRTSRAIDVELTWTPTDQPITLRGAEGKSYGGLALRFGPRKTTVITVSRGREREDLVMTNLLWADFSGDLKTPGDGALSGIAIFVHPDHPDFPPEWMARHYGMLAVGWPGVEPVTLAATPVTLRYRLWIHRGNPEAGEIEKAYDAYFAETKGSAR